jgi:MAP3K TRAFs-binding domain
LVAAGLDQVDNDFDVLTLKGRLLKDRARKATGAERSALFAQAGAAYERAASLTPDSYPLINAAAMALFAGDRIRSATLAQQTLSLLDNGLDQGETPYWGEATRSEVLLLLGQTEAAKSSLAKAMALAPRAWEDHAATLRQFRAILEHGRESIEWLDPLRPPAALHYSGILGIAVDDIAAHSAIRSDISALAPAFGYGALAAGADIIAAEALLASGAELHVVLPADPDDFKLSSVDPYGSYWSRKFDELMAAATSVCICTNGGAISKASIALGDYVAMGLAAEKALLLECKAIALRIGPAGRPTTGDPWHASGRDYVHITVERSHALSGPPVEEGELAFHVIEIDGGKSVHPTLASAAERLAEIADVGAAIDCSLSGGSVVDLLRTHAGGRIVASKAAVMALVAEARCSRIEPIGEIAHAAGTVETYSLKLAPNEQKSG